MGNLCRVYVNTSVDKAKELVGNHPAILRYGENAIKTPSGDCPKGLQSYTEINLINTPIAVATIIGNEFGKMYIQDLDAFGHQLFTHIAGSNGE